ncbi:MAG: NAD-dependent epimerase/dehydratase family protein [Deltaproteobacteria bacterium]|nr:NAD-dependent epimerase/dehydratase family protein [Deltaproteobacteria bacterium]MBN2674687.1 NAD-dependent epimerase/dehydratase family protein [Deltaproteobacteria bacterium]
MNGKKAAAQIPSKTIALCGAAGLFGNVLVRALHRECTVFAIDPRDFSKRPKDVFHHQAELTKRSSKNHFRKRIFDAVIHVGANTTSERRGPNKFTRAVENYAKLLDYCDQYNVKKLILISSANLYGARPSNSQFLQESAPLLSTDLSSLREMDMMTQSFFWKRPDIETVILRPANVTGTSNGVLSKYLRHSKVPTLLGFNPMIQLIHEQDLIQAVMSALHKNVRGIFNIAGAAPVPLRYIIKKLNRETIDIPHPVAAPVLRHMNKLGKLDIHPTYIDYIRYICMVDDTRARDELEYTPQFDLEQTIEAIDLWW